MLTITIKKKYAYNLEKNVPSLPNTPADAFATFDGAEEQDSSKGVGEDEKEHAGDNEETLVHRHHHRQHQHL